MTQTHPEIEQMVSTYNQRRQYMIKCLRNISFTIAVEPRGAFYVFANAKKFCNDSYQFALDLLKNTKVAVTPGIDFGDNGEGYLRFSYANSLENIEIGMDRLENYLKK